MQLHYIDGSFRGSTLINLNYFYNLLSQIYSRLYLYFCIFFTLNEMETCLFIFVSNIILLSIQQGKVEKIWT